MGLGKKTLSVMDRIKKKNSELMNKAKKEHEDSKIKGSGAYSSGGPVLKNPNKADLDKSGNLSRYEKTRAKAIEKSMGLKSGGLALKGYGKAYMKGGKVK